ncbi:MAG: hypothetical protein J2P23_06145 [Microlunatus sp.]|nr:hypothetical protein [Microlunatus sp.]
MRICVLCGSSPGRSPASAETAAGLGLLKVEGCWALMTGLPDQLVAEGFLPPACRDARQIDTDPVLLQTPAGARPPVPEVAHGSAEFATTAER